MAAAQSATQLTDVTRGHIDGCIYHSPANLRFGGLADCAQTAQTGLAPSAMPDWLHT
jgi:predicted aconitase